jgi:hypothetical protein
MLHEDGHNKQHEHVRIFSCICGQTNFAVQLVGNKTSCLSISILVMWVDKNCSSASLSYSEGEGTRVLQVGGT